MSCCASRGCRRPGSSRTSRSRFGPARCWASRGSSAPAGPSWRRRCSAWIPFRRGDDRGWRDNPRAWQTPAEAIALGIGLVPEDRKRQGLVPQESGVHNLSLAILRRLARFGWLRRREERSVARSSSTGFASARRRSTRSSPGLSGGNQQKIVLARWLAAKSRVLILDEPTRGVDVGAKAEIHGLIGELANQGAGDPPDLERAARSPDAVAAHPRASSGPNRRRGDAGAGDAGRAAAPDGGTQ